MCTQMNESPIGYPFLMSRCFHLWHRRWKEQLFNRFHSEFARIRSDRSARILDAWLMTAWTERTNSVNALRLKARIAARLIKQCLSTWKVSTRDHALRSIARDSVLSQQVPPAPRYAQIRSTLSGMSPREQSV